MHDPDLFNNSFLNEKRHLGDSGADSFIKEIFGDAVEKKKLQEQLSLVTCNQDLILLKNAYPATSIIATADRLPAWANPVLMKEGSDFFIRYAETIMTLLGLLSLPYCYTAANGAMVLYQSERMQKQTTTRLYKTALFVWDVMAPNAFAKDGKAFSEILKVRLLHAAIRYYTLQTGKWDQSWGLPVNQEDMAGTNLSFSLIVMRGLRMMGFSVSYKDQIAFTHLWAVIGYFSGLDNDMISQQPKMAQLLDIKISQRQFRSSAHGQELAKSLTDHIIAVNNGKAAENDILGLMRYLLGAEVADMLAINAPELAGYKVGLLKATNLFKSLKPQGNSDDNYHRLFSAFKKQQPAEQK